jgi:hypothetical protein
MHIHHLISPNRMIPATPWPSINVPEWRLWDAGVTWPDLEPSRGQWRFGTLDKSVEMAEQHHTEVMLTLGFTPQWASARPQEKSGYNPGWAAEPRDIEDWRQFVQTVATRYKGRIRFYEIWNEPNLRNHYWTGSVEQMIALVHTARDIIKSIDRTSIIVSPSAAGAPGIPWFSDFLRQGGGQYIDVIGFHFYVSPSPPETMLPLIQEVRQIMVENGVGDKPLWNTESGWSGPKPFPSEDLGAAYLARAYILNWAAGVQRLYWYAWDNHGWVSLETTESDSRALRPAGRAYSILQNWLVGSRIMGCASNADHTWSCELNRDGSPQWVVWSPDGTKQFVLPVSWHVRTVTPLLDETHDLNTPSVVINPMPQLLR